MFRSICLQEEFKNRFIRVLILCLPVFVLCVACGGPDVGAIFERYLWEKRIIVVATPARDDGRFQAQVKNLRAQVDILHGKDVVQWYLIHHEAVILDDEQLPHLGTPAFYRALDLDTDEFSLIVIGQDGEEKYRTHDVVSVDDIVHHMQGDEHVDR